MVLHSEKVGTMTVKLVTDESCENNPRDWDNFGTMACWHRRYQLGDEWATNPKKLRHLKLLFLTPEEVRVYDAHIQGQCFGYVVEDEGGNHIASCWGYHGFRDVDWDYALGEAKAVAVDAERNACVAAGI